jgi:hydroxypyruvate isomerase
MSEYNLIILPNKTLPAIGEVQVAVTPRYMELETKEINYHALANALDAMDYKGSVGLESSTTSDRTKALEALRSRSLTKVKKGSLLVFARPL